MDLILGAVISCLLILIFFLGIWLYYDRRDHALYDVERRKVTFHCLRCGQLYTAKSRTGLSACPRCGHENARLKF